MEFINKYVGMDNLKGTTFDSETINEYYDNGSKYRSLKIENRCGYKRYRIVVLNIYDLPLGTVEKYLRGACHITRMKCFEYLLPKQFVMDVNNSFITAFNQADSNDSYTDLINLNSVWTLYSNNLNTVQNTENDEDTRSIHSDNNASRYYYVHQSNNIIMYQYSDTDDEWRIMSEKNNLLKSDGDLSPNDVIISKHGVVNKKYPWDSNFVSRDYNDNSANDYFSIVNYPKFFVHEKQVSNAKYTYEHYTANHS